MSSLFAYVELLRLPNLFTAVADVAMGFLFVRGGVDGPVDAGTLMLLIAASCCFYSAGTVLNDVFDLETDKLKRPERPLPSGRVAPAAAHRLGRGLLIGGLVLGGLAAGVVGFTRPAIIGAALAGFVVLYNAWMKRTPLGPAVMGGCRMLNVLLGMSVASGSLVGEHWLTAGAIGTYVTGVTWFARSEADRSSRLHLASALVILLGGIGLLAWLPEWPRFADARPDAIDRWRFFVGLLGLMIGWRCFRAVLDPTPLRVQVAVKECILSLIVLDAAVVMATSGFPAAVAVLLLLAPAVLLGRWISST